MEFIENVLEGLGLSLTLIVMVGIHILEEALKGFRRFFNLEWFQTGNEDFPVTKLKALLIDQIGLFLSLALLTLLGLKWPFFVCVVIGFITADLVQHSVFTIARRKYTPGVTTSVLYLVYVFYFFIHPELWGLSEGLKPWWTFVGIALGAAILVANYILAAKKVQSGAVSRPQ